MCQKKKKKATVTKLAIEAIKPSDKKMLGLGSLNIDTDMLLPGLQGSAPDDETKEKIHFIVNNATHANLRSKAEELKELLNPEQYW